MSGNDAETLADHLATVIGELDGVVSVAAADAQELHVGERLIAVLGRDRLEVVLGLDIAAAACRTRDVMPSDRGPGWVSFRPSIVDRFALDRAEAWLRIAHRGTGQRA